MIEAATVGQLHRREGSRRGPFFLALLVALAAVTFATACTSNDEIPPLELRAQGLNKVIMCPVCPGESIDQSQHTLAYQMRDIVIEQVEQGRSDDEIKAFFVDRYGPSVLLEPPRRGFSLLVWLLPPAAGLAAGVALYLVLRLMRGPVADRARETQDAVELTDEDRARYFPQIEAAVDHDRGGATRSGAGEAPSADPRGSS